MIKTMAHATNDASTARARVAGEAVRFRSVIDMASLTPEPEQAA